MSRIHFCALLLAGGLLATPAQAGTQPLTYEQQTLLVDGERRVARVPVGYRLEWLAAMDGSRAGKVYRLPPPYTRAEVLVNTGGYPHSVAFRPGEILIAKTDGVYRAPYRAGQARLAPQALQLLAALPAGGGHNSRTVGVGPDGRVYVSLGIQRNCSDQYLGAGYAFDDQRGGVLVLHERDGKAAWQTYASGLRNPVGFDWHPQSGVLYANNNGPDHLGFGQPPEYFSRLDADSFHGMPWFQFNGKKLQRDDCVSSTPPRI